MIERRQTETVPEKNRTRTAVVALSLALNAVLLAMLFRSTPSRVAPTDLPPPNSESKVNASVASIPARPMRELASAADVTAFRWAQVESSDYRQYIANLRAIGCPEAMIRDIITADVAHTFARRAQEIWKRPPAPKYWQKPRNERPNPDQMKALEALHKEQTAILTDLLGAPVSPQQMVDTLLLQLHGAEQELLFLPADKREAAMAALADPDVQSKELEMQRDYSTSARTKLYEEQLKHLADVLSPEELAEFRLRNSPTAEGLRNELQYFDCTPEEFKALMDLRDSTKTTGVADLLNRTAATEQARALWGDERAKEFAKVTDLFYVNARRAAENFGVPADRAEQAWQITSDARAAADQIAKNTGLSVDERKRQIDSLQTQTDSRLMDALGPKAALGVSRDLRVIFRSTSAVIRP